MAMPFSTPPISQRPRLHDLPLRDQKVRQPQRCHNNQRRHNPRPRAIRRRNLRRRRRHSIRPVIPRRPRTRVPLTRAPHFRRERRPGIVNQHGIHGLESAHLLPWSRSIEVGAGVPALAADGAVFAGVAGLGDGLRGGEEVGGGDVAEERGPDCGGRDPAEKVGFEGALVWGLEKGVSGSNGCFLFWVFVSFRVLATYHCYM